jgi:citrate lyase beta subunit
VPEEYRSRRSCLAVPGSGQRFLDKARGLAADEMFLDLEDVVAPAAKEAARRNVIAALNAAPVATTRRSSTAARRCSATR